MTIRALADEELNAVAAGRGGRFRVKFGQVNVAVRGTNVQQSNQIAVAINVGDGSATAINISEQTIRTGPANTGGPG